MKKLILFLLLLSTQLWAAGKEVPDEIPESELNKKLISTVKEFEIEGMLDQTAEFKECKEQNKFTPGQTESQKEDSAEKAAQCFRDKLSKQKDGNKLGKLSEALGLQSYGLVSTKTTKDLTEYFGDKMYKALTGVDRKEKDYRKLVESMKFKNRKMVDQQVFLQMYRTQLIKNSLYEISRFCFENFRIEGKSEDGKSFGEYWQPLLNKDGNISVTDTGSKGFGDLSDTSSKDAIYQSIFKSLDVAQADKFKLVEVFFMECAQNIVPLCDVFEASKDKKNEMKGANACLSKAKIQKHRKAIADVKKVIEGMNKDMNGENSGMTFAQMPEFYDGLKDGENSIDNLTNYSSSDFIEGGLTADEKLKKKQNDCSKSPENAGCEDFIVIDDSREKVESGIDMDMRLKKEVEIARVRELKEGDKKKLEEYLTENGYLDLLEKWKQDSQGVDIESEIGKIFEARRVAALAELKNKIGKRQMTEEESKEGNKKEQNIKANAEASKEERARLAQVVLFNNVITGYLKLFNKEGEELGRNINVLKKETKGLETANVDSSLFENLKTGAEGESSAKGGLFDDPKVLDMILSGKKSEEQKPAGPGLK